MPMVRKEGKDTIIFASKEEHATPSKIDLPEPEPGPGLILPNGEINWNCPCLGGMATGPCGLEFREAFSCFHYSTSDPKGSDCYEAFKTMQVCMLEYPSLYGKKTDQMDLLDEDATDKLEDSDHMAERKQDRTSSALSKVEESSTPSSQKEGPQSVAN